MALNLSAMAHFCRARHCERSAAIQSWNQRTAPPSSPVRLKMPTGLPRRLRLLAMTKLKLSAIKSGSIYRVERRRAVPYERYSITFRHPPHREPV